jgi:hypothetical protein
MATRGGAAAMTMNGDAPEEHHGDQASGQEPGSIVKDPVALHGSADFQLHNRHARKPPLQARAGQVLADQGANLFYDGAEPFALDHLGFQRQDYQRQLTVFRKEFAANDVVGPHPIDQLGIGLTLGELLGEYRTRQTPLLGRAARREERDDAARTLDQLQVGDKVAQLRQRTPFEQRLSLDHDQDVELGRREAPRQSLILAKLRRLGAEQLAERVIHLDAHEPEDCRDRQQEESDCRHKRSTHRKQADALHAEREIGRLAKRRNRLAGRGAPRLGRLIAHAESPMVFAFVSALVCRNASKCGQDQAPESGSRS